MGIRDRQQFKNEQVNEGRTPQTGAGHDRGVARLPTEGNHVQVSKAVVILRRGGLQNTRLHGSVCRVNSNSLWPFLASFQAYFGENI